MAIESSDIAKLAKLARIEINDVDARETASRISDVLALVDQLQAVNTDGVFHVSQAVARVMAPRRRGAMVTVSSNAAGIPRQNMAAYAASKAGLAALTTSGASYLETCQPLLQELAA